MGGDSHILYSDTVVEANAVLSFVLFLGKLGTIYAVGKSGKTESEASFWAVTIVHIIICCLVQLKCNLLSHCDQTDQTTRNA